MYIYIYIYRIYIYIYVYIHIYIYIHIDQSLLCTQTQLQQRGGKCDREIQSHTVERDQKKRGK